MDKFSYNITEQGTSSFKSSEIQLPPRKAKNTLFRKSFAEFGFFPPPYQSLEAFHHHHDSYYNVISCLTYAYTHKNSKKISRSYHSYFVATIFSINTHEEEQGLWSIQLFPVSPT